MVGIGGGGWKFRGEGGRWRKGQLAPSGQEPVLMKVGQREESESSFRWRDCLMNGSILSST